MPKGVRLNPQHDERTRAKIQTSQIINRLEKLVNGEIEMSSQQVRAAEILLRKTLPDLQTIEYKPPEEEGDKCIKVEIVRQVVGVGDKANMLPCHDG